MMTLPEQCPLGFDRQISDERRRFMGKIVTLSMVRSMLFEKLQEYGEHGEEELQAFWDTLKKVDSSDLDVGEPVVSPESPRVPVSDPNSSRSRRLRSSCYSGTFKSSDRVDSSATPLDVAAASQSTTLANPEANSSNEVPAARPKGSRRRFMALAFGAHQSNKGQKAKYGSNGSNSNCSTACSESDEAESDLFHSEVSASPHQSEGSEAPSSPRQRLSLTAMWRKTNRSSQYPEQRRENQLKPPSFNDLVRKQELRILQAGMTNLQMNTKQADVPLGTLAFRDASRWQSIL